MSKTRIVIIALIIAVLFGSLIGGTAFYYNGILATKNSEIASLANQTREQQQELQAFTQLAEQYADAGGIKLKIVSLEWIPGSYPIEGANLESQITFTVQNQGEYDVDVNITFRAILHWANGEHFDLGVFKTTFNGIHAGETKQILGHVIYGADHLNLNDSSMMLVGQLWIGQFKLDEKSQVIPNLFS
jgi:hypothetical protein